MKVTKRELFFAATGQNWLGNDEAEKILRDLALSLEVGESMELPEEHRAIYEKGEDRNQRAWDTHLDWLER